MKSNFIIADPIHQVMNFGSDEKTRLLIKNLLATSACQRLRRISQLGMASFVFPGATHTRFSHSLGVAHLARNILSHLIEREEDRRQEIKQQRRAVMVAALLHDIGHGPFSHSFENVLVRLGHQAHAPLHEDWTHAIINDPRSDVAHILDDERHGVDKSTVASIFSQHRGAQQLQPYLKEIVSSQLDADRLDYLVRDAHFAGVEIGRIDVQYLINCTMIIHDAQGDGQDHLGLVTKGVKAYETFAFARYLMNRSVYLHKAVNVLQYMMEELIRLVILHLADLDSHGGGASAAIPGYFRKLSTVVGQKLDKASFMKKHFADYFDLTEASVWNMVEALGRLDAKFKGPPEIPQLARRLLKRELYKSLVISGPCQPEISQALEQLGHDNCVVQQTRTTLYKRSVVPVLVGSETGSAPREISSVSDILFRMKDHDERETLIIITNPAKEKQIKKIIGPEGLEPQLTGL